MILGQTNLLTKRTLAIILVAIAILVFLLSSNLLGDNSFISLKSIFGYFGGG
jgi:hypothetical protein